MKRHLLIAAVLCGLFLPFTGNVQAQTPNYMNYQGKLTQADASPLPAGNYNLEINIYDDPNAGTKLWGPFLLDGGSGAGHAPQATIISGGRFNVIIGPTDTTNRNIQDVFKTNGNRYVELKVNGGSPILPRQQFLSAPFATRAALADQATNSTNLNSRPASDFASNYNSLSTYGVPSGTIVLYHGTSAPAGWKICDGTNGTPDLRGRFPIGISGSYPYNTPGGSDTHTHSYSATTGGPSANNDKCTCAGSSGASTSSHTHTVSGDTGSSSNIPPYFPLLFIMKI